MFSRAYTQTATYWGSPTSDGLGGSSYAAPVELKVRWEERGEEFVDREGETRVSNAIVWTTVDLETLGFLALGAHTDVDPTLVSGAYRILEFRNIPSISNRVNERRAFL